jgi:hypothetical protein
MMGSDVKALAALSQIWTAVGTIWRASETGGQNITKCLQLRNTHPRAGYQAEARRGVQMCLSRVKSVFKSVRFQFLAGVSKT